MLAKRRRDACKLLEASGFSDLEISKLLRRSVRWVQINRYNRRRHLKNLSDPLVVFRKDVANFRKAFRDDD